ncbi:hypothetical protein M0H57_003925 [Proteus mirabilis]|uniref:hypothetical protein n=1 Tax=Proteus mirabilis TaxID=584 RepID=UPI0023F721E6|nr:hypothetical protein [Proteus mirabilis]EKX5060086.1 hypothetical protein [Proteus mirabilis]EKX5061187.1 hypothetical protein [Proteus mirabilis]MDF7207370.1 hypothetical protein [Proteus mirabilis]
MNRISTSNPFHMAFSVFSLGFLFVLTVIFILSGHFKDTPFLILIPILMFIFGCFFFKKTIWSAADDVFDFNDHLLVKKGAVEETIFLKDILSVEGRLGSPERVIISFRDSKGEVMKVMFHPKTRIFTFSVHPVVLDLNRRFREAKSA